MLKHLFRFFTLSGFILNVNSAYAGWCDAGNRAGAASYLAAAGSDSLVSDISTGMTSVGGAPGLGISYRRCTWDNIPEPDRCWTENQFIPTGYSSDSTVKKDIPSVSTPSCKAGSIIYPATQVLGEIIPLVGSSFNLNYYSNRVRGRIADYIIRIPISSETVLSDVTGYDLTIKNDLGSTIYTNSYGTSTNQSTTYTSNGLNGSSQEPWGTVKYTVTVDEISPDVIPNAKVVGAGNLKYKKLGIEGWAPSIWYFYDPVIKTIKPRSLDLRRFRPPSYPRYAPIPKVTGANGFNDPCINIPPIKERPAPIAACCLGVAYLAISSSNTFPDGSIKFTGSAITYP